MARQSVFEMPFEKVYQCLVQKAERKGRTQAEVDQVIKWLTGYVSIDILTGLTYGDFLSLAPVWNSRSELITGSICGIKVEEIAVGDEQDFLLRHESQRQGESLY